MHLKHFNLHSTPIIVVLLIVGVGIYVLDQVAPRSVDEEEVIDSVVLAEETDLQPEGESHPLHATWRWTKHENALGELLAIPSIELFSLTLHGDGTFETTTDCNSVQGSYVINDANIIFSEISMTKMFCENSSEQVFVSTLEAIRSFSVQGEDTVQFFLEEDGGTATFTKQ